MEKKKEDKASEKSAVAEAEEDEEDNDDTLEQRYAAKTQSSGIDIAVGENGSLGGESDKAESGDEVAETTADASKPDKKKRRVKKTKYVPEGESSADRDRRTVFVGNVAVEVLKSKVSRGSCRQAPIYRS